SNASMGSVLVDGNFNAQGAGLLETGGSFVNAGSLEVETGGAVNVGGNYIQPAFVEGAPVNATMLVNDAVTVRGRAHILGGALAGRGTITAREVQVGRSGAHVTPGADSIGSLTIVGDYTQRQRGVLEVKVIGGPIRNDQVVIEGRARLRGALEIHAIA